MKKSKKNVTSFAKKKQQPMILKNISFKNFKCFKEKQSVDFQKLTILTGANSSGKSSLMYAVLGALQTKNFPLLLSTNGRYVNMGDFKEVSNKHNINNEIELDYLFASLENEKITHSVSTKWKRNSLNNLPELSYLSSTTDYFSLTINKNKNYNLNFSYDISKDPSSKNIEMFKSINKMINSLVFKETKKNRGGTNETREASIEHKKYTESFYKSQKITNYKFDNFENLASHFLKEGNGKIQQTIDGISDIFSIFNRNTNFISSYRLHPERTYLEKSLEYLKVTKFGQGYLDQIILWEEKSSPKLRELKSIMKGLSLLIDIKTNRIPGGRYETQVITKTGGTKTSISDVGFGISQFLPIIVADLQLDKNSTLFISQPEIHLNPSVQSSFGNYICDQIKEKQKNYIIETHSEYFLNKIRLAIVKKEIKSTDVALYHIENKKGDAIIHKIILGDKGQIENAPDDFFRTYMIDVMDIALNS